MTNVSKAMEYATTMKEEWLLRGAVVPVDVETTSALLAEIKRLIYVTGGMALEISKQDEINAMAKRTWVGLTEEEKHDCYLKIDVWSRCVEAVESKLKEKNGD